MTTSGVYTFSVSRDQIVQDAMFDCGALGVGESMSDNDLQFCSRRLNMMVKQWQGQQDFAPGLKTFTRTRGNLFLSASTGQYQLSSTATGWAQNNSQLNTIASASSGASTIQVSSIVGLSSGDNIGIVLDSLDIQWTTINGAPSGSTVTLTTSLTGNVSSGNTVYSYPVASQGLMPISIISAVLRDQFNNDTPLYRMTVQDYQALPTKAQTTSPCDPGYFYFEERLTGGRMYLDCPAAADCNKYIHIVFARSSADFVSATDTPDYPQAWYLALVTGLSCNIAPAFQLPVTQDMRANFATALAIAQQANAETSSLFFQKGEENYAAWSNF